MINLKSYLSSSLIGRRQFSLTKIFNKSHYDTLGLTPHATLNEIKKAYYNLSMLYHPDKSNGSVEALQKFREVTEAYEVLSNLSNKRLYDKGALNQVTKKKTKPIVKTETVIIPNLSRTPIYNFDEWSRNHYGDSIQRRAAAKHKFSEMNIRKESEESQDKSFTFIMCLLGVLGSTFILLELNASSDFPSEKSKATPSLIEIVDCTCKAKTVWNHVNIYNSDWVVLAFKPKTVIKLLKVLTALGPLLLYNYNQEIMLRL